MTKEKLAKIKEELDQDENLRHIPAENMAERYRKIGQKYNVSANQVKNIRVSRSKSKLEITDEKLDLIEQEFLIDPDFKHVEGNEIRERYAFLSTKIKLAPSAIEKVRKDLLKKHGVIERKRKTDEILKRHFEDQCYVDLKRAQKIADETSTMTALQVKGWFYSERARNGIHVFSKIPESEEEIQRQIVLEKFFEHTPKPSEEDYENLAQETNIKTAELKIWFHRKRSYMYTGALSNGNCLPITATAIAFIEEEYKKKRVFGKKRIEEIAKKCGCVSSQVSKQILRLNEKAGIKIVVNPLKKDQIDVLEEYYREQNHAYFARAAKIAKEIGVEYRKVTQWFVRKRNQEGVASTSKINMKRLQTEAKKKIRNVNKLQDNPLTF